MSNFEIDDKNNSFTSLIVLYFFILNNLLLFTTSPCRCALLTNKNNLMKLYTHIYNNKVVFHAPFSGPLLQV